MRRPFLWQCCVSMFLKKNRRKRERAGSSLTTTLSKIDAVREGRSSSVRCSTWANSTALSWRLGAKPLRSSRKTPILKPSWRFTPKARRPRPIDPGSMVGGFRLSDLSLHRPRQWGACWMALHFWDQLALDNFFGPRLPPSRKGTNWLAILKTLVCYRLMDPGSEWRLHRDWFENSAMADLLGEDFSLGGKDNLYRCHRSSTRAPRGPFQPSEAAVGKPLRRPVRPSALRPDQHLFRVRCRARKARREAPIRLQPG